MTFSLLASRCRIGLLLVFAVVFGGSEAQAQLRGRLLSQPQMTAIPGSPFGVGTVTVPMSEPGAAELLATHRFSINDVEGRVFYPAFSNSRLLGFLPGNAGSELTVSFLFTGSAPLRITVHTPQPHTVDVVPQAQAPRLYQRELAQWWRNYNNAARQMASENDFPPLVHTYLTSMLGNRLGLQPPLLSQLQNQQQPTELQQTLDLLAGSEKIRASMLRQALQPTASGVPQADYPVPGDALWAPLELTEQATVPTIEPIAMAVPEECFYIRFGSFENYLWLSRLTREYGGDIGQMVALRGHNAGLNEKMERQLALKDSALAEMFGGTVIADVAMIGRDLYEQDGAAIGVLFKAKNNLALATDFRQKHSAAAKANQSRGATLETIDIAGKPVSFLSTPDNYLRSFYVASGDFHLVTSSRDIARRFLEVAEGSGSLGASPEFQHAREVMPTNREDTIFAYFSSAFFRGLVSPQYQVELARRLQAAAYLQAVRLARHAALAEGQSNETLDDLVEAGLLPPYFGRNADGSGPILERDRELDSLRGALGSFLPIPDVELRGVTADEAERYAIRAQEYSQNWRQMDPLMVGIKRYALDEPNQERIVIDANVSPLAEEKYGWLMSRIGPPTDVRIVTPADELISVQASLNSGSPGGAVIPHHLFAGVQDVPPHVNLQPTGLFEGFRTLREIPGYVGAWPQLGILDWLPLGLGSSTPDPYGYSKLLLGGWRWQSEGFSMVSFDRGVLERTVSELRVEPTDNPAQIRVQVRDLSQSQLSNWLNFLNYERATQTSVGNSKLLQALSQQLRIPPADALSAAEKLLDTQLVCSLGGQYELIELEGGLTAWRSTHWPVLGQPLPEDYRAPALTWFRGLNLDLTKYGDRLVMHAELDMERAPAEKLKLDLPLFKLFGLGSGGDKKKPSEPAPVTPD